MLEAKDKAQRASKGRRGKGNGHHNGGIITDNTEVTWHTCKDPKNKCGHAHFVSKAGTKVTKHYLPGDVYCGTCMGGKGCKGC